MLLILTSADDRKPPHTGFVNINDLERPLTPKGVLLNFSQFLAAAHMVNCDEMPEDRPRQPAYKIFSIKHRFYQSKCRLLRFKEACALECQIGVPV